jgi:hypothetical protein
MTQDIPMNARFFFPVDGPSEHRHAYKLQKEPAQETERQPLAFEVTQSAIFYKIEGRNYSISTIY